MSAFIAKPPVCPYNIHILCTTWIFLASKHSGCKIVGVRQKFDTVYNPQKEKGRKGTQGQPTGRELTLGKF